MEAHDDRNGSYVFPLTEEEERRGKEMSMSWRRTWIRLMQLRVVRLVPYVLWVHYWGVFSESSDTDDDVWVVQYSWSARLALCVVRNVERTWWSSVRVGQQRVWPKRSPSERERPSQWSERWLTILERSCCWRKALGEAKELWLCASQISEDRHVFFFDCSEEADRGIDHSDFSG